MSGAHVWPVDAVSGVPLFTGRQGRQLSVAPFVAGATAGRPLGAFSGVRPGTPTTTVTATSTTWTVGEHAGVIDAELAAEAGPYTYSFDAAQTGSMTAADPSNPRIDVIYVRIDDPAESDGTSVPIAAAGYQAGTPAATPAAPTSWTGSARSMVLAQINVPKVGGGSPSVTWVAPYLTGPGGIVPNPSTAQQTALNAVATATNPILIDDNGIIRRSVGAGWVAIAHEDSGWITPTLLNSWVNFSPSYRQVAYRKLNGIVYVEGVIKGGASVIGQALFNLPAGFRPTSVIMRTVASAASGGSSPIEVDGTTGNVQQGAAGISATWTSLGFSFPADA